MENSRIDMARVELAKRELARRQQAKSQEQPQGMLQRAGNFAEQNINKPIEENFIKPANSLAAGFEQGLGNIVPGVANLGVSGANALGANIPKAPMFNFAPDDANAKAGELASFFMGPGAILKGLSKVPELANTAHAAMKIPMIAKGFEHARNMIGKSPIASKVAGNAILGGAYAPDDQLTGMALGGAVPLIGKGLGAAYEKLRPSNLFRGNLTPEQLRKNLEVTQGNETGLGDVIGSPMLKRMNENILSKIPLSGANETMMKTAGKVVDQGHGILKSLLGKNKAEDIEQDLNTSLQDVFKSHQANKDKLYGEANKLADQSGLELRLPGFGAKASQFRQAIEDTNILKYEPEMAALMNKLSNYQHPVSKEISNILGVDGQAFTKEKLPSLKEANLLKGKLNDLSAEYKMSPDMTDRHKAKVFGQLAAALKGDIQGAIKKHGHKPLESAYNAAEENYAKNFSPFLDKEIYKFGAGNADPDQLISSFIKTGKANDRAHLLKKLTSKLPPEKKNLLGYGYLQRALDENNVLNPMKVKTLLSRNALGPRQFKALFPDEKIRNELLNYTSLVNKNTKGLKLMENPETGQMNMDILPLIAKSPGGIAGKIAIARPITKALTNEKTRNNLVRQMIANDAKKP